MYKKTIHCTIYAEDMRKTHSHYYIVNTGEYTYYWIDSDKK